MKYTVGSKWTMTTDTGQKFDGVVLHMDDDRIKKIKCDEDVCMYFPEIQWGTTYDAEFLDQCCVPWEFDKKKET